MAPPNCAWLSVKLESVTVRVVCASTWTAPPLVGPGGAQHGCGTTALPEKVQRVNVTVVCGTDGSAVQAPMAYSAPPTQPAWLPEKTASDTASELSTASM